MTGYLEMVSETSNSPTAQVLRLLDAEIDALMDDIPTQPKEINRARAAAFSEVITILTFADADEIRNVAMLRYEARNPDTAAEEDED